MQHEINTSTFLYLLRIAIGTEEIGDCNFEGVSWQAVYRLARQQGVLAIAFDGLTKLFEHNKEFAKAFPQSLKLQSNIVTKNSAMCVPSWLKSWQSKGLRLSA